MRIHVLLFNGFEALDVIGPLTFLASLPEADVIYYSCRGGLVSNQQGLSILTEPFRVASACDVLLIPGGRGTRDLVSDKNFLMNLKDLVNRSTYLLSVCTGSALLACAGLLDGKSATTNKKAYDWVTSFSKAVDWKPCARWVVDGHIYTSSGVSAGMDMALGFIADQYGQTYADECAQRAEYHWNPNSDQDAFAILTDK